MDQLHLLWEYQKADMEVDKLEASIRRSPVRQKLVKYRDYYAEQQTAMKRIESEVATMQDRLEALKDAIKMTDEQLVGYIRDKETAAYENGRQRASEELSTGKTHEFRHPYGHCGPSQRGEKLAAERYAGL